MNGDGSAGTHPAAIADLFCQVNKFSMLKIIITGKARQRWVQTAGMKTDQGIFFEPGNSLVLREDNLPWP